MNKIVLAGFSILTVLEVFIPNPTRANDLVINWQGMAVKSGSPEVPIAGTFVWEYIGCELESQGYIGDYAKYNVKSSSMVINDDPALTFFCSEYEADPINWYDDPMGACDYGTNRFAYSSQNIGPHFLGRGLMSAPNEGYAYCDICGLISGGAINADGEVCDPVLPDAIQLITQGFLGSTVRTYDGEGASDLYHLISGEISIASPLSVQCATQLHTLWPPNHELVDIGLVVDVYDTDDPQPAITVQVYSNEQDEGPTSGDAHFWPDAERLATGDLLLRSERKGNGQGRIYLIIVTAIVESGNDGFDCATVIVPHNNSQASVDALAQEAAKAEDYCRQNQTAPPSPEFYLVGEGE